MKFALIALLLSMISLALISQDDFGSDAEPIAFDESMDSDMAIGSDEVPPTPTPFPTEEDMSFDTGETFDDIEID